MSPMEILDTACYAIFTLIGASVLLKEFGIWPRKKKGNDNKHEHSTAIKLLGFAFFLGGLIAILLSLT